MLKACSVLHFQEISRQAPIYCSYTEVCMPMSKCLCNDTPSEGLFFFFGIKRLLETTQNMLSFRETVKNLQQNLETCSCYILVTNIFSNFLQRQPGSYLQWHQLLPEKHLNVKLYPLTGRRRTIELVLEICPLLESPLLVWGFFN